MVHDLFHCSQDISRVIEERVCKVDLKQHEEDHKTSSLLSLGIYPDALPTVQDWLQDVPMSSVKSTCLLLLHINNQIALDTSR